jgi:hypothetical protein
VVAILGAILEVSNAALNLEALTIGKQRTE